VYNPNFNYGEFATIKNKVELNNFKISAKELVEKTNAISIQASYKQVTSKLQASYKQVTSKLQASYKQVTSKLQAS